jgi:hypothetical protein
MLDWQDCGRKQSSFALNLYPTICLKELREIMKNLSQNIRLPDSISNTVPIESDLHDEFRNQRNLTFLNTVWGPG